MIRLKSVAQARQLEGQIPALALLRVTQFEGSDGQYDPDRHGYIVVINAGDDIGSLPEISDSGLLAILDPECPGYEFLESFEEEGGKVWEMAVAIDADKTIAVIIPDHPDLDPRLRRFLATVGAM